MTTAQKLRTYRKKAGLTQSAVAEKLNISQSAIAQWEAGSRMPDINFLCILADIFRTTTDDLLGRETMDNSKFMTEQQMELLRLWRLSDSVGHLVALNVLKANPVKYEEREIL